MIKQIPESGYSPYYTQRSPTRAYKFPIGANRRNLGSIYDGCTSWESCRELFHELSNKKDKKVILYCADHLTNVMAFIEYAEKILKVDNKAGLFRTNYPGVLYCQLNWWKSRIRQNLFTIFLRAGEKYDGDFWECANRHRYLKLTKPSFTRFMNGYTNYCYDDDPFIGWVKTFRNMPQETIEKVLVKK